MTFQIRDTFILNGKTYTIKNVIDRSHRWFSPLHYGFSTYYRSTDCWRGYQCCYAINEGKLNLITLNINNRNDDYPPFMGATANTMMPYYPFTASYNNIYFDFKFTGKVIIVNEYMYDKYGYREIRKPWMFKKVIELDFRRGKLISLKDKSEEMNYKRIEEEVWNNLLKDKLCQEIFQLCCQWIEENKHTIKCDIEDKFLKEATQYYMVREKLLSNLGARLPGRERPYLKKCIKNNIIKDSLYQNITNLCEKWMVANLDRYKDIKIERSCIDRIKGINIKRRNTKTYRFTLLRTKLFSSVVSNNIYAKLQENYPSPPINIDTNTVILEKEKTCRGLFSKKQ